MPCFYPLQAWRARTVNQTGKRGIVFNPRDGFHDLPVTVACGQCVGCRLERSRQWAIRCVHEAELYDRNCFVTLTYADEFLPEGGSLVKSDFQKFMKRLRKRFPGERIRFYHCGEYGEQFKRPHYHAVLFGFDFPDKLPKGMRNGFPVWESTALRELWPYGRSEIGSVTFQSAAYVARYVMKKVTGEKAEAHYASVDGDTGEMFSREPEYVTMSRRPGIGKRWFDRFKAETYRDDAVLVNGRLVKPPRFYDMQFELEDEKRLKALKVRRRLKMNPEEQTPERLAVREECAKARVSLLKRSVE